MQRLRERGFTLVELIVVIAIVGVLAGVLLIAINPAALLAKGRDSRRLDDLDALNKAISLSLADAEITLGVVAGNDSATGTRVLDGTGYVAFTIPTGKTGLSKYISTLPIDPTNVAPQVYWFASTATNYELNAVLESTDNAAKMSTDGGNDANRYEVGTSLTVM